VLEVADIISHLQSFTAASATGAIHFETVHNQYVLDSDKRANAAGHHPCKGIAMKAGLPDATPIAD